MGEIGTKHYIFAVQKGSSEAGSAMKSDFIGPENNIIFKFVLNPHQVAVPDYNDRWTKTRFD